MLKILQISDLHILPDATGTLMGVNTDACFRKVLKEAHADHGQFDLIIVTGDLAQNPSPAGYLRIMQTLQIYQTPTLCLPGNHDDFAMMQTILNSGGISCSKHLQMLDWQIICLNSQKPDSPVGLLSAAELLFLECCLDEQPETPTLIALHHPCVSSGSPWLDSMQLTNSAELLELLSRHKQVKAVTFGHVHQEIACRSHDIALYSVPATCFQFLPQSSQFSLENSAPGYRLFELFADGSLKSACYRLPNPPAGLRLDLSSY